MSNQLKRTKQCYQDMKQRCYNPKAQQYKNYGARGIYICDRWLKSFDFFFEDMGLKKDGLTLDRIDVNGNYEPNNCRWATSEEQQSNRRNCKIITYNGESLTQRQWAIKIGIHEATIASRLKMGHPLHIVLTSDLLRFGNISAKEAMSKEKQDD